MRVVTPGNEGQCASSIKLPGKKEKNEKVHQFKTGDKEFTELS